MCRVGVHTHLPGLVLCREAGGWWGSGDLQWGLQHLHEEGVNGCVPDELEEEEVLQALQADRTQGWEAQQQLGKPAGKRGDLKNWGASMHGAAAGMRPLVWSS